jgi:MOSC domain-containing protein YiiM
MWQGRVVSLHVSPRGGAPMEVVPEVRAVPGRGLEGDRYFLGSGHYSPRPSPGGREVTLIETETIAALFDGVLNSDGETLDIKLTAAESRRNIATAGVPLNHLVGRTFWVGAVQMRGTRLCEPCQYLEDLTARPRLMRGLLHRGGLRAQIVTEGVIRVSDVVRPA